MKKRFVFSIIGLIAAGAGIAWAVAKLLKRGNEKLNKDIDYDDYYVDEDFDSSDEAVLAGDSSESSFDDIIPEDSGSGIDIDIDIEPYNTDTHTETDTEEL